MMIGSIASKLRSQWASSNSSITEITPGGEENSDSEQSTSDTAAPPRISTFAIAHLATSTFLDVASYGASFAPVPGLETAFSVLRRIITTVDQVGQNKDQCEMLRTRATVVLQAISLSWHQEKGVNHPGEVAGLVKILKDINRSMITWNKYNFAERFLRQSMIKKDVQRHMNNLDNSLTAFGVMSHLKQERLLNEIHSGLFGEDTVGGFVNSYSKDPEALMRMNLALQTLLRQQSPGSEQDATRGKIIKVQSALGGGLPNTDLSKAECEKVAERPAFQCTLYDIYEGKWMGSQKVALKLMRSLVGEDEERKHEKIERLNHQVRIWSALRNEYVCPLYGVCTEDGPYPYLVTPWYSNGDAAQYAKHKPTAVRMQLCLEVAYALRYLHNLKPPVVHGNIRGSNILISDDGKAQLSDFGLSAVEGGENLTSVQPKQRSWMSPEALRGHVSPDVDVWAWAMTTLELLSGKRPFFNMRMWIEIPNRIVEGARPQRDEYLPLGIFFSDELWSLLEDCWQEREKRAQIGEVVSRMEVLVREEVSKHAANDAASGV